MDESEAGSCAVRPYENEQLRRLTGGPLRPGGLELTREGLTLLRLPPDGLVLDLGCGAGASLDLIVRELGLRGVGLDLSEYLLRAAASSFPGLPILRADAHELPFASGIFTTVCCECVLSLTAVPEDVLSEIHRVLKPGGRLLLSDLYRFGPPDASVPRRESSPSTCASGALTQTAWEDMLSARGFAVRHRSDHTAELKRLAGQIIFANASLAALCGSACAGRGRLGYFRILAQAV